MKPAAGQIQAPDKHRFTPILLSVKIPPSLRYGAAGRGENKMSASACKPIPRTSLEPVCLALAAVIRERRRRAGWSLNQLAARTGLSRQMLSFVETERRVPTVDTVARISRAFELPLSQLFAAAERRLN